MEHQNKEQLSLKYVSSAFIKERYIKCPYSDKNCKWRMKNNHKKGYEYLNGACYLSGSFKLECPN